MIIKIGEVYNTKEGIKVLVIGVCHGGYVDFEFTVFDNKYARCMDYYDFLKIIK